MRISQSFRSLYRSGISFWEILKKGNIMKKNVPMICLLFASILLSGCNEDTAMDTGLSSESGAISEGISSEYPDPQEPEKLLFEKIPQIKAQDTYITLEKAAEGFDNSVITQELIDNVDLPDATVSDIPYWTGFTLENKIFTSNSRDERWSILPDGPNGVRYWYEGQIVLIAQEGFNCARCCYALSYLGSPDNPLDISENALAELDALISWGLKYNVHIMLTITGNPDMWNAGNEENVSAANVIQDDPYYNELYYKYMTMLVARYKDIPAKAFSIELLAEPTCSDWDSRHEVYARALLPTIEEIHRIDPDRILIAQDVSGELSDELAQAGCVLSIHPHLHSFNENRLREQYGFTGSIEYPVTFLPKYWYDYNGTLTFHKDSTFNGCTLKIHYEYYPDGISVTADGVTIYKDDTGASENSFGVKEITIPDGTTEISITPLGNEFVCAGIEMLHDGHCTVFPVGVNREAQDYSSGISKFALPTITLDDNYKVLDNDLYGAEYTSEMFYANVVAYSESIAEKYGVGFILTEICGDNEYPLEEYLAFEEIEVGYLREHKIPWMWNCMENVIGPKARMWPTNLEHQLRETSYKDIYIDDAVMDFIKSIQ